MTRVVSFHDHALLPDFGLSLSRSVYAGIPEEPEHSHDFLELVVVTHGSGIHNFNGEQFRLAAGNIFVIMPGVTHSYLNEDDLELYSFLFFDEFLEPFRSDLERISGYHLLFSLEPSRHTVAGVGRRCGFSDSNYFSTVFRKHTGCSPREFLRRISGGGVT